MLISNFKVVARAKHTPTTSQPLAYNLSMERRIIDVRKVPPTGITRCRKTVRTQLLTRHTWVVVWRAGDGPGRCHGILEKCCYFARVVWMANTVPLL